jgi:hypothetical protein
MRAVFHSNETFEENSEFAFKKIPDGPLLSSDHALSRRGQVLLTFKSPPSCARALCMFRQSASLNQ